MHRPFHPLHAILLAGTLPLFMGVLLNDVAYAMSSEIQWKNFASWLIVGGLVFGGFALLGALIELFHTRPRPFVIVLYPLLLSAMWIVGIVNAFVHAGDAWATMPTGLILAAIAAVLASIATGLRFYMSHARATV